MIIDSLNLVLVVRVSGIKLIPLFFYLYLHITIIYVNVVYQVILRCGYGL